MEEGLEEEALREGLMEECLLGKGNEQEGIEEDGRRAADSLGGWAESTLVRGSQSKRKKDPSPSPERADREVMDLKDWE